MRREIDTYKSAIAGDDPGDYFLTTTASASLERYHSQGFYRSTGEFVFALAEAMRVEYEMIAEAGFLVQVDDASRGGTELECRWG